MDLSSRNVHRPVQSYPSSFLLVAIITSLLFEERRKGASKRTWAGWSKTQQVRMALREGLSYSMHRRLVKLKVCLPKEDIWTSARLNASGAAKYGPYSAGVEAGDMFWLSGQIAVDFDGIKPNTGRLLIRLTQY